MTRDHLDRAIDQVAARMTRVDGNDALAAQILNALPERSAWSGWWSQSWAPRLAVVAVAIAAGIVWTARNPAPTAVLAGVPTEVPPSVPTEVPPSVPEVPPSVPTEVLANARAMAVSENHRENLRENLRENDRQNLRDFEHSLPSIAAVASLELEAIAPASLPEDAPLTLAPLAIADLPAAESISPRQE